jgi:hypothetical protein
MQSETRYPGPSLVEVEASFAKERSGGSCWNLSIPLRAGKEKWIMILAILQVDVDEI